MLFSFKGTVWWDFSWIKNVWNIDNQEWLFWKYYPFCGDVLIKVRNADLVWKTQSPRFLAARCKSTVTGTVQWYCRPSIFFSHNSNIPGPLTNSKKNIFDFGQEFAELFKFLNFPVVWVKYPRVWYPSDSIFLGHETPVSQSPWSIISRRNNKNPTKPDSQFF